jgi:hypothetical protein
MALINEPHNAYPLLPVVAYTPTTVSMADVENYIVPLTCPIEIGRSAYITFRNEGGNGKHGVNENYIGEQADGAMVGNGMDSRVIATCVTPENGTHRLRRFCCFASWKDSVDILIEELTRKGLYIGGHVNNIYCVMPINTIEDWVLAYYRCWVTGSHDAVPPDQYYSLFKSLYQDSQKVILQK